MKRRKSGLGKKALIGGLRQVSRLPLTRRAIHRVSVAARGSSIAFLRCRRLLPETSAGRAHPDRLLGSAMTPDELDRALRDCQRTLTFVHPGEALAALERGERLKRGRAVLTFDESFAATAELALPVLEARRIPALFFVTTGHLDGNSTLWDQAIHTLVGEVAPKPLALPWLDRVLRTDTVAARGRAVRRLLLLLLALDEERLKRRLDDLYKKLDRHRNWHALDRMMTSGELASMAKSPWVSVGAHGHEHLAFASISDEKLVSELEVPRKILRSTVGDAFLDVVSYPFGRVSYVGERAIQRAREAGYRAGFTAHPGVARPGDHLFTLPRLAMGPTRSSVDAYELQGLSDAVDELLLVLGTDKGRRFPDVEG